jgi:hypothetical protein
LCIAASAFLKLLVAGRVLSLRNPAGFRCDA